MNAFDIHVNYEGLSNALQEKISPGHIAESYFLDLRADAKTPGQLADEMELFTDVDITRSLELDGDTHNISVEGLSEHVTVNYTKNQDFNQLQEQLNDEITYSWQLVYQNECSELLDVVEGLENDFQCRLRMLEDSATVSMPYDSSSGSFRVNPAERPEDTEYLEHELFEKACNIVRGSEFDAFAD